MKYRIVGVLVMVFALAQAARAEMGEVQDQGLVMEVAEDPATDVLAVNEATLAQLAAVEFAINESGPVPEPILVIPPAPVPIPVEPEAPQPLPIIPPPPVPAGTVNSTDTKLVFNELDPLGILGEEDAEEEEETDKVSDTEEEETGEAGETTETKEPPKPPVVYEGDAAKDAIKSEVTQKLYQAYLNYYNGKYSDKIMAKIKALYEKYKAEMAKYYAALNTCPVCQLAVCNGTVYYCQGSATQTTTPMGVFINFMQIYHPDEYQKMVDQGIVKK